MVKKKAPANSRKGKNTPTRASDIHGVDRIHRTPSQEAADGKRVERDEDMTWKRESDLTAPPPRGGFVQRWIRSTLSGQADGQNVRKAMREGWHPRALDTVPEGFDPPTISHGEFQGVIGVEGMILCEMPAEKHASREEYYNSRTKRQNDSIEADLRQAEVPGGPRIAHSLRSRTSVGGSRQIASRERPVEVADD